MSRNSIEVSNDKSSTAIARATDRSWFEKAGKDLRMNYSIYLMLLPALVYYILFHYMPMYGAQIAFKDFDYRNGIWGSAWVGLKHFSSFFQSYYFLRLLRNTVILSFYRLVFGFPAPILLALLINEVKNLAFKKTVQTISYLPHFISMVVVCGMIVDFCSTRGIINDIIVLFGGEPIPLLSFPQYFRTIYTASGIWQEIGWGSIIYLASISNIDQQLYEAAKIDGAKRFRQAISVTIPGITPMIVILLILQAGNIMSMGAEKILLLYSNGTYETADVISTFIYRRGLLEANYSYSTAVGLFNSIINFIILISVNTISRNVSENSLW